jgi:flagellar hook-associated protein 2
MINSIASSLGFGSGINTTQLVSDLAAASRGPKVQRLDGLARSAQTKISALAQARGDLDSFATSLASVSKQQSLRTQPTVSDANIAGVAALAGARLDSVTAELRVIRLAQSQTSVSPYAASASHSVGQGNLTLSVSGQNFTIAITPSNDSLTGFADAINGAGAGVRANVVTDAMGARLVLKGESGAAKAFTITPDPGADPGLAQFATAAMTTAQAAQDSEFKVDGVTYGRATNRVSDVIAGVDLTLKSEAPGTAVIIGTQRPVDTLRETAGDFVSVFNTLKSNLKAAREASGGAQSLRALDQQLARLIGQSVNSHPTLNSLSDIGIQTNRDGTISLNSAVFEAAIAADPSAVEALFAPTRDATHSAVSDPGISGALTSLRDSVLGENGSLVTLQKRFETESSNISRDRDRMELREAAYRARLERQYGTMDARIGALRSTQSYLEQQVKVWTNNGG